MSDFQRSLAVTLGVVCLNLTLVKGFTRAQKIACGIIGLYWWSIFFFGYWHV